MTVKTYEELGREADMATRAAETAKRTVMGFASAEEAAKRLRVTIEGADWNNGLLHLVPYVQTEVARLVAQILPAAIQQMEDAARGKVDEMHAAFQSRRSAPLVAPPRVPRAEIDTMDPALLQKPDGYDHAQDGSQAAKSPATPDAGTMAPSGPSGGETGEGAGQVPLGHALAPGQPSDPGKPPAVDVKLTTPQSESLAWIGANPGKNVAHTADIARLVNDGLVARSGNGKVATYTATDKGQAVLAQLAAAGA